MVDCFSYNFIDGCGSFYFLFLFFLIFAINARIFWRTASVSSAKNTAETGKPFSNVTSKISPSCNSNPKCPLDTLQYVSSPSNNTAIPPSNRSTCNFFFIMYILSLFYYFYNFFYFNVRFYRGLRLSGMTSAETAFSYRQNHYQLSQNKCFAKSCQRTIKQLLPVILERTDGNIGSDRISLQIFTNFSTKQIFSNKNTSVCNHNNEIFCVFKKKLIFCYEILSGLTPLRNDSENGKFISRQIFHQILPDKSSHLGLK